MQEKTTTDIGSNAITFTNTFIPKEAVPTPKSIVCGWQVKGFGYADSFVDDLFKFQTTHECTGTNYAVACILNCTDDGDGNRTYPILLFDFDKKDNLENCTNEGKQKLLKAVQSLDANFVIYSTRSGGVHVGLFLDDCRHFNVYKHIYKQMVDIVEERSGWKSDPKVLSERRNFIVPIHPRNMYKVETSKQNTQCKGVIVPDAVVPAKQKKIACTATVGDKYSSNLLLLDKLVENGAIDKYEETQNDGKTIYRIYMNGEDASTPLNWYCFGEGYYFYSYTDAELKMKPSEWFYGVIAKTEAVQNDVEWWDDWSRKYFYFDKLKLTNEAGWMAVKDLHGFGVSFYEDKFQQRIYAIETANPNVIRQNPKPQELTSNLLRKFETDYPTAFVIAEEGKKPAQIQKSQYLPNVELYANEHGKNRMVDSLKADLKRVEDECPELLDKTPQEVCKEMVDAVFGDKLENKNLLVEAMAKFTFASVARAVTDNPDGYKFDNCIVLEGKQGIRKSTFCQYYCGAEFHESMGADAIANHKDMVLAFDGKRVVELEECSKITRQRDANHIKAHLSQATDTIRKPYAAETFRHVRRYVHIATTNDSQFLKDSTGNRRFWCVKCNHNPKQKEYINADWLKENRWRMWGYFYHLIQKTAEEDWSKFTILPHQYEMAFEDVANGKIHESDTKIQIRMWFDKAPMSEEASVAETWDCFAYHTAIDSIFANASNGDFQKTMDQKQYNYYASDFKEVAAEYGYEYIRNRAKDKAFPAGEYRWCRNGIVPDKS